MDIRGAARSLWLPDGARHRPAAGRPQSAIHDSRHLARLRANLGVHRDFAPAYMAATGDDSANEGSMWLEPEQADAASTEQRAARPLRARRLAGDSDQHRPARTLACAYSIAHLPSPMRSKPSRSSSGLTGVSFAASSTALARRAEFGMLRHIGMLRRQIIGMLAGEGLLTSVFGVLYGLTLGGALSLVLVYVVNRQSFNWSIDLAVPVWAARRAQPRADGRGGRHGHMERPRRHQPGCGAGRARGLVACAA